MVVFCYVMITSSLVFWKVKTVSLSTFRSNRRINPWRDISVLKAGLWLILVILETSCPVDLKFYIMWRILNLVELMSNKPKSKLVELMFCWKFLLMFQEIICKVFNFYSKESGLMAAGWKLKWWTRWENNQLTAPKERIAMKTKATTFSVSSLYLFFWWWITEVLSTFSRWKQVFMTNYHPNSKLPVREAVNLTKVRKIKHPFRFILLDC